jgi:hypothetical protein
LPDTNHRQSETNGRNYDALNVANFILSIIGVAVVIAYTAVNGWQASLTAQSIDLARRQLELSQRPWLAMEVSLASPLTFTDKYGSMFAKVSLKNIGNSVAVNVHPFCKLGAERYANGDALTIAFEDKACGNLGEQSENDPNFGGMLFPN